MTSLYFYLLSTFVGYIIGSTIITLGFYIRIMKWKKKGIVLRNAAWWQKGVGYIGVLSDVVYNYTTLTLVMWQFPRSGETLATSRFKRTVKQKGWRSKIAKGYCWMLNKFDKGHCN